MRTFIVILRIYSMLLAAFPVEAAIAAVADEDVGRITLLALLGAHDGLLA